MPLFEVDFYEKTSEELDRAIRYRADYLRMWRAE